jgi:type I restriction enzyme S subunit
LGAVQIPGGLVGGPFGSNLGRKDYRPAGIPVIRGANLSSLGRFDASEFVYVSPDKARELIRNSAIPGDVVFTQRGTLGQVGIVPEQPHNSYVISQSQMRLRCDPKVADPRFMYYLFRSPAMVRKLESLAVTTGVPHINLGTLAGVDLDLPPLRIQVQVAQMLGALDDKIDLNRRISRTALDLVDKMFHKARPSSGTWARRPITVGVEVLGGGTPKTSIPSYWDGDIPWVSIRDLADPPFVVATHKSISAEGARNSAAMPLPDRTVVISARGTVGELGLTVGSMSINQSCYGLHSATPYWLYMSLLDAVAELRARAHGSVFDTITRATLDGLAVPAAPPRVVADFEAAAKPFFDLILANVQQNRTLAELRDLLLPKLICGEIRVREAADAIDSAG